MAKAVRCTVYRCIYMKRFSVPYRCKFGTHNTCALCEEHMTEFVHGKRPKTTINAKIPATYFTSYSICSARQVRGSFLNQDFEYYCVAAYVLQQFLQFQNLILPCKFSHCKFVSRIHHSRRVLLLQRIISEF